jgi:ABC-type multidrug transport system fused ATPase/permease subunit
MKDLLYLVGKHRSRFIWVVVWGVLSSLFMAIANPWALKLLFDEAIIKNNFQLFVIIAASTVAVFSAWRFLDMVYRLYRQRLSNTIQIEVASRLMATFFRVPYRQVISQGEGYFLARTHDEVQNSVQPATNLGIDIARALATLVGGLGMVLVLSWQLTLVLAVVTPVLMGMSRRFSGRIHSKTTNEQENAAQLRGVGTSLIQSYKSVRMFGLEKPSLGHYQSSYQNYLDASYSRIREGTVYSMLSGLYLSWVEMGVIVAGGYAIMTGGLSFGGLMAFMNAFWLAVNAMQSLVDAVPRLATVRATVDRLREFEGLAQAPQALTSTTTVLTNTSVKYGDYTALEPLNLQIIPGTKLLIEGPNGSGKSTLANVLSGFLDPDTGHVQLSSVSATVEPMAFPALCIRELLEDFDPGQVASLTEQLGLSGLLEKPYTQLSLGQKKRVNILLTLLKDAQTYIFDEPLANLDAESQNRIMQTIIDKTAGKTLIMILHAAPQYQRLFDQVLQLGHQKVLA